MSANIDLKYQGARSAFEQFCIGNDLPLTTYLPPRSGYSNDRTRAAYIALQARAALAAAPAATQEVQDAQPLFWYRPCSDGFYEGPIHNATIERLRKESGGWVPLFPGAAPQPAAQPHESLADRIAGTISRHINEPLVQAHVLAAAREIAGYATHPHPSGDSGQVAGGQQDERADEQREMGLQLDRACLELPEGWELRIELESGAGSVSIIDPKGEATDITMDHDGLSYMIADAIDTAIVEARAQQDGGDGRAQGGGNG